MNSETKNCLKCQTKFTIEPDDFGFYERVGVPTPEKCPQCRQQLRMLFRNFKTLYKRPSSKSREMMVSVYNPEASFPVYGISQWWGDDWDALSYGIDLDWNKPFFEQLGELLKVVPHVSMANTNCENSEYSNQISDSRNCYLIFGGLNDEDCSYGHIVWNTRDSVDNLYVFKSEYCYECVDCLGSSKLLYSRECEACIDSIGLFDCRNCLNCIGCVGQVNKSYCIFNKQVKKEEYDQFLKDHPLSDLDSITYVLEEMNKLKRTLPQRSFFGSHNNNVSGNHIYNARNIHDSFDIKSGENSKFCFTVREAVDSYDISFTGDLSECYECLTVIHSSNKVIGSQQIVNCHDIYYSENCHGSDNLFGCYGLRKKSYCILNKQYTKDEYQKFLPLLIEHMKKHNEWGGFIPKELSPFAYNESIANEYMPLSRDEALKQGFKWQDKIPSTSGQETIAYEDLPKDPETYDNSLLKHVLKCDSCYKNYRLIKNEILFYKKLNLPLPRFCFNCRHQNRMDLRLPRKLAHRQCMCEQINHSHHKERCPIEFETSYDPKRQEIVYCEKCYQQEIY